jgi:thiol-disulfide isomerase/thioredoxin
MVLTYAFGPRAGSRPLPPPPIELLPRPVPLEGDWTLVDASRKTVSLASLRGRPVFLNVWATWCPPCVAELPSIAALAADPRLRHVAFACVSNEGDLDHVAGFLRDRGIDVPYYVAASEPPEAFQTEAIPATFILDAQGRIVSHTLGAARWDDPAVVTLLEKLRPEG